MNKEVSIIYEETKKKMSGYLALFIYRLMNLCITAEPVSLLSIDVKQGDNYAQFEDMADVIKPDDYHFIILPKYDGVIKDILKSILRVHPEFKVEYKSIEKEGNDLDEDEERNKYLYVTMPEVNDDRYDVLKDGVNSLYEQCKTKESITYDKNLSKILVKLAGAPEEKIDEAKQQMELLKDQISQSLDKYKDDKLDQIEKAYNKYLLERKEEKEKEEAKEKAQGKNAGKSMKLFGEEDDD